MKKLFYLIIFLSFFLLPRVSVYAQSSDCWQEYNYMNSVCGEGTTKCNECIGSNQNPACTESCNKVMDLCTQAGNSLKACLGVDKNPIILQPKQPGHLSCDEWKVLFIAGSAQNCPYFHWAENRKLWCSSSIEEGVHKSTDSPGDYILDFVPSSCMPTEADFKQFKAGLPLTSGSSPQTSQNMNSVSKFVRDVQNYFKPSGINAGKEAKPDFSIDKPPFKDPKTVAEEAKTPNPVEAINNWVKNTFGEDAPVIEVSDPQILNRTPGLSDETVSQAKQKFDPQKSPYQIPVLNGEVMVKPPGSNDWAPLKEGDKIIPGSAIFTGMDSSALLMIRDKGIVEILPFTEITVSEQGLEQAGKEGKTSTDIKLHMGEVEVNVEGGVYLPGLQIQTTNGVAGVRGTHFWVNYELGKTATTVGVYRGTVDVKNAVGNGQEISSNGDKPGVVAIVQKLSILKLSITGLILTAIIVGTIFFLKRRKIFGKRR